MQAVFIVRFWATFYVIIGFGFIGIKSGYTTSKELY